MGAELFGSLHVYHQLFNNNNRKKHFIIVFFGFSLLFPVNLFFNSRNILWKQMNCMLLVM